MKTNSANVYVNGTFENKIAAIFSHNLHLLGHNGNGPMESIFRGLIFPHSGEKERGINETHIDWVHAANLLIKYFPEAAHEIIAIKSQHGIT